MGAFSFQFGPILGVLKHDGSQHFVVLVGEDVAVIDISGVLPHLICRHVEEISFGLIDELIVVRFGPSRAALEHSEPININGVFPFRILDLGTGLSINVIQIFGVIVLILSKEVKTTNSILNPIFREDL